jgi:hypothetical protein
VPRVVAPVRLIMGAVLAVGTLIGCTADPESSTDADPRTESRSSGRQALLPLVAPMGVASLRWADGNLPRTVPEDDDPLPSLLDDPPGRALVASYVPRPALGFEGEAIEFYGVDGRWRRLALGDLDLPEDGWSGGDTYGAGALSPNGRWWAGPMIDGMLLVDLRDASTTVRRVESRPRGGMALFAWSPDSDELVLTSSGQSTRASVPAMTLQPFPRPWTHPTWIFPSILTDGGWSGCPYHRRTVAQCNTYGPDGALVDERSIPEDLRKRSAGPSDEVAEAVFYSLPGDAFGNHHHDWEILRTDLDFHADARLILPAKSEINGVQSAFDSSTLELAAIDGRLLLAWLVDEGEIVRLIRPGIGGEAWGMDWWDVSFARDLVRIR